MKGQYFIVPMRLLVACDVRWVVNVDFMKPACIILPLEKQIKHRYCLGFSSITEPDLCKLVSFPIKLF